MGLVFRGLARRNEYGGVVMSCDDVSPMIPWIYSACILAVVGVAYVVAWIWFKRKEAPSQADAMAGVPDLSSPNHYDPVAEMIGTRKTWNGKSRA